MYLYELFCLNPVTNSLRGVLDICYYISYYDNIKCGVLPQGTPVVKMPGTGLPCGVPQCGEAEGKFHVQALPVSGSGVPGGKVASAPLQHV